MASIKVQSGGVSGRVFVVITGLAIALFIYGCTTDEPPDRSASPTTAAAARGSGSSAVMPSIPCGTNLQEAQNRVQDAGVFFSRSEDATGQGRSQVRDRNWTVVGQWPSPGTPIGEGDAVFSVVKNEEFAGC